MLSEPFFQKRRGEEIKVNLDLRESGAANEYLSGFLDSTLKIDEKSQVPTFKDKTK